MQLRKTDIGSGRPFKVNYARDGSCKEPLRIFFSLVLACHLEFFAGSNKPSKDPCCRIFATGLWGILGIETASEMLNGMSLVVCGAGGGGLFHFLDGIWRLKRNSFCDASCIIGKGRKGGEMRQEENQLPGRPSGQLTG